MYGVVFNIRAPHRYMRMGARCWLRNVNPGDGNAHLQIIGMSRGGRIVETWIDTRDLTNFRPAWFPDGYAGRFPFDSREGAAEWAAVIEGAYCCGPVRPYAAAFGRADVSSETGKGLE